MTVFERIRNRPRTLFARRALFQIHLWTGIIVGLYAVVIGISGAVLVFREEIIESSQHEWRTVPVQERAVRTSPDVWLSAVRRQTRHKGQLTLQMPQEPNESARFQFFVDGGMQFVFVDPYTAEILAVDKREGGMLAFIDTLHSNLFLKRTGRLLNGFGALALLLLSLTGIVIWWPGVRLFKRTLMIDGTASWRRINFDLHHVIGFWCMAGIALISITGAYFTWPQFYRECMARLFPLTPSQSLNVEPLEYAPPAGLTHLLTSADTAVPNKSTIRIMLPADTKQPVRIVKNGSGQPVHRTATTLMIHPLTAEILRVESFESKTTGDRLINWIGPLHAGNFGGLGVKALYGVLGLSMPVLFFSGFVMWWERVVRKKWLARKRPVTTPFPETIAVPEWLASLESHAANSRLTSSSASSEVEIEPSNCASSTAESTSENLGPGG